MSRDGDISRIVVAVVVLIEPASRYLEGMLEERIKVTSAENVARKTSVAPIDLLQDWWRRESSSDTISNVATLKKNFQVDVIINIYIYIDVHLLIWMYMYIYSYWVCSSWPGELTRAVTVRRNDRNDVASPEREEGCCSPEEKDPHSESRRHFATSELSAGLCKAPAIQYKNTERLYAIFSGTF